ncbi:MAG: 4Fe-4S binding protein [Candidatus Omnitrophica bacterium]|nr:4Fe-4S binding protein [Candidatus Omnitrophota bacterium]
MAAVISVETCTGCSACVDACPVTAIKMENEKAAVSDECIDCGACVDQCPVQAITMPD